MSSTIEQIKQRLSIVEVVGSYLKLEKAGSNYRARCPFHNEKSPSFFVSPTRQSYHCFGCNKGGDLISFVQEIEGLDFVGALKVLAERAGVTITFESGQNTEKNSRLYKALQGATEFYKNELMNQPQVKDYLKNRGLTEETVKKFELGFAPEAWRALADKLLGDGFTISELEDAGLIIRQDQTAGKVGGYYDRFRKRIMFPLFDSAGRPIGFSGRVFQGDEQTAKYVNSPATSLYNKSNYLFGYDKAKLAIHRQGVAILVEGQLDLLMSHQIGVDNVVAASGTALTEQHLAIIKRLTDRLILSYDYDAAGLKASRRALDLALAAGFDVRIAKLPLGQDPADVAKDNPEAWREAVKEARHHIDFLMEAISAEGKVGLDYNRGLNRLVLPYIKALPQRMLQAQFVSKVAQTLGIGEQAVWDDLYLTEPARLTSKEDAVKIISGNNFDSQSRMESIEDRLLGLVFWSEGESESELSISTKELENKIIEALGSETWQAKKESRLAEKDKLALASEIAGINHKNWLALIEELLFEWRSEYLKNKLLMASAELKKLELAGDRSLLENQLKICQSIREELNNLIEPSG